VLTDFNYVIIIIIIIFLYLYWSIFLILVLLRSCFLLPGKKLLVPTFKKVNSSLIANYRPNSILNNLSKVFEFVISDHVSYYLQSKLNCCQHGFIKSRSTTSSLVTYLDYITPLVSSQRQVDAIYFDFSSAFDLVSHTLLLGKLSSFGLTSAYVSWFRSYLTDFRVLRFLVFFRRILESLPVFLKALY
jgi:hypothetical protein